MKRTCLIIFLLAVASAARAAVFEQFLSPERPADRAIIRYVELERAGKATSNDLADLGVLLVDKGFPQDAEHYLEASVKLDKKNYEAWYRLGLVRQRMGHDHAAIRAYKKAVSIRTGFGYARFMLALAEEHNGQRNAAIRDYAKAYKHMPELTDPEKNPLVLDSHLQTEAQLLRYRREVAAATLKVTPIDPAAVRRMMEAQPPRPTPETAPAPVEPAKPAPVQPAPPVVKPPAARSPHVHTAPTPVKPAEAPSATPQGATSTQSAPPKSVEPPPTSIFGPQGSDLPPIEMRSTPPAPSRSPVVEPPGKLRQPTPPAGAQPTPQPTPVTR